MDMQGEGGTEEMKLTLKEMAGMIDHTNLKAFATKEDFQKLCDEAKRYGFKSVAINTYPVKMCSEMLQGSQVLTGAAISFPLGQTTVETKVFEAQDAIKNGAGEFDYVLNVGRVKMHDWAYIEDEMRRMVAVAREAGICCKVIFETCYLTQEEIIQCAQIASRVKPDFVKTSTGFGTGGATPENVALMKQHAGPDVKVKAAGGIRSFEAAKEMIEAGAQRLGTSAGVAIMEEMKRLGME